MIRIGFRRRCAFWYKDIQKAEEVFNWLINESYNKNQIIIPCSIYGEVYIWLGGGRRRNILYDIIKV